MTRRKPPQVQVMDGDGDPYLLVRAATASEARERAETWLAEEEGGEPWCGEHEDPYRALVATVVRDGWHRWIPAQPDDDYARWLHPAKPHARGAFRAWDVEVSSVPVAVGAPS